MKFITGIFLIITGFCAFITIFGWIPALLSLLWGYAHAMFITKIWLTITGFTISMSLFDKLIVDGKIGKAFDEF